MQCDFGYTGSLVQKAGERWTGRRRRAVIAQRRATDTANEQEILDVGEFLIIVDVGDDEDDRDFIIESTVDGDDDRHSVTVAGAEALLAVKGD